MTLKRSQKNKLFQTLGKNVSWTWLSCSNMIFNLKISASENISIAQFHLTDLQTSLVLRAQWEEIKYFFLGQYHKWKLMELTLMLWIQECMFSSFDENGMLCLHSAVHPRNDSYAWQRLLTASFFFSFFKNRSFGHLLSLIFLFSYL